MHILVISIYYRPEPVPKPFELAEGLVRRGHRVTVLTGFPSYPAGKLYVGYRLRPWQTESIHGVRVVRLPMYPDHSARAAARLAHTGTFFLSLLLLGPFLCGKVDAVYVWGNPPTSGLAGWIIARLRRAPLIYGVHDLWPELVLESGVLRKSLAIWLIDALERFVLRHADFVLPISQGFARNVIGKGVPSEKVAVLPHWADEGVFHPAARDDALARRLGVDGGFVVLYAGNIGRLQGLDELIQAAASLREELPHLRVLLVGDGVEKRRLQAEVAARKLDNVLFADRRPQEEIPAIAAVADALYVGLVAGALAGLSVPSKVPAYLACGRPILSNVPGETAELIERHQIGITCQSASAEGIAGGVRLMAGLDELQRRAMGERARRLFLGNFAIAPLLEQHEAVFNSTLVAYRSRGNPP